MPSNLSRAKLRDTPADAVLVIDEQELEESRRDPRVRELFACGDALLAELDGERAVAREMQPLADARAQATLPPEKSDRFALEEVRAVRSAQSQRP